jgi:hypothetical protein
MTRPRRLVAAVLAATAVLTGAAGCKVEPDLKTRPVSLAFPSGLVPTALDGMTVQPEPSAQASFARIGKNSAVAHGEVWTLRQDGLVVGSIQVSQLKGGLSTKTDRVRAGIRAAVNNIPFRWFKVLDRQWVGVQPQPQLDIYLWIPQLPATQRDDVYVVAQLKSTVANPDQVITDLIAYEEKAQ